MTARYRAAPRRSAAAQCSAVLQHDVISMATRTGHGRKILGWFGGPVAAGLTCLSNNVRQITQEINFHPETRFGITQPECDEHTHYRTIRTFTAAIVTFLCFTVLM